GRSPSGGKTYWPAMNPGLVEALDGPVVVENDANLAVLAERAGAESPHLAALLMGERFGAGLVVDSRLLRGAEGGAGEMRFLDVVMGDDRGTDGVAALARRWTLEALAEGETSSVLGDVPASSLTAVDVFAAARDGDRRARAVLAGLVEGVARTVPRLPHLLAVRVRAHSGERVATIAAIRSSLLGVELVVVAGAIAEASEPVLAHARAALPRIATPPHPRLEASALGADVVVHGAIELALARLREDPLDLLAPDV